MTPAILDLSVGLDVPARRTGSFGRRGGDCCSRQYFERESCRGHGPSGADGADRGLAADTLLALPLIVIDLDAHLAIEAGAMLAQTKPFGLSLGDRACLALAKREGLPALTADRTWAESGALGRCRGQADLLTAQPCRYSFIALLKKKSRRFCSGSGIGSTWVGSS